jgi:hypothetical protein
MNRLHARASRGCASASARRPFVAGLWGAAGVVLFGAFVACVGDDPTPALVGGGVDGGPGADGAASGNDGAVDAPVPCAAPRVVCGTACVDPASFASDPDDCGACGHGCLGGACAGGACQPVTILAPKTPAGASVASIAVDAKAIYFAGPADTVGAPHGAILSCPIDAPCTSPVTLYAAAGAEVDALLTTSAAPGYLFYTDNGHGHVFRIVTDGTASPGAYPGAGLCSDQPAHCAMDLDAPIAGPNPLASDGASLFTYDDVGGDGSGGIKMKLPDGASSTGFGNGATPPVEVGALGLALDPSDPTHRWLYVAGEHGIFAAEPAITGPASVVSKLDVVAGPAGGIAVGSQTVFYTRSDGVHTVGACNATGCNAGTPGTFASTTNAEALVADATDVYWTAAGHVFRCPQTGCPAQTPIPIAALADRARALTQDATSIYWGDDRGGLYRLAK